MRGMISGLVAVTAVMVAGAAPAMACGGSSCATGYVSPCASSASTAYVHVRTGFAGCAGFEHLADPTTQYRYANPRPKYYYVNQGPTFAGPGAFAPYPVYEEASVVTYGAPHRHRARAHYYRGQPVLRTRY